MSTYVLPPDVSRPPLYPGPGPEALSATRAAARVADALEDSGHEMRFASTPDGDGRVGVEIRNRDGTVVATLSPTDVLAVAAGEVVPGVPVVGEARWPWL